MRRGRRRDSKAMTDPGSRVRASSSINSPRWPTRNTRPRSSRLPQSPRSSSSGLVVTPGTGRLLGLFKPPPNSFPLCPVGWKGKAMTRDPNQHPVWKTRLNLARSWPRLTGIAFRQVDPRVMSELMKCSDFQGFRQALGHLGLWCATGSLAYLAFSHIHSTNWIWSVPILAGGVVRSMGPLARFWAGPPTSRVKPQNAVQDQIDQRIFPQGVRVPWLVGSGLVSTKPHPASSSYRP